MTKIITNTTGLVVFRKETGKMSEKWFGDNNCSDEALLRHCGREGDTIDYVQFYDANGIGNELHVHFKKKV